MIIALTGHRPHKLGNEYDGQGPVSMWLLRKLTAILIEYKPESIISGMALGADMLWAEAAVNLQIPFMAAVPFIGQELKWPQVSQDRYKLLLAKARETVIVSPGGYAAWKMQKRNEFMVDHANLLVAVWDGSPGGTKNCYDFALSRGKDIRRIDPRECISL